MEKSHADLCASGSIPTRQTILAEWSKCSIGQLDSWLVSTSDQRHCSHAETLENATGMSRSAHICIFYKVERTRGEDHRASHSLQPTVPSIHSDGFRFRFPHKPPRSGTLSNLHMYFLYPQTGVSQENGPPTFIELNYVHWYDQPRQGSSKCMVIIALVYYKKCCRHMGNGDRHAICFYIFTKKYCF